METAGVCVPHGWSEQVGVQQELHEDVVLWQITGAVHSTMDTAVSICNACNNSWKNSAYGGDINRGGVNSCVTFWHCYPNCNCPNYSTTALPPGMFSECGGVAPIV